MDAFYASVEEREQPALRGKPLVVGGRADARGVVAAANYAARRYGVKSAMPTALAVRRCPHLIIIAPRAALYAEVSTQLRDIFNRYTPVIEPLSLDEAFLDPRGSERLHGDALQIGKAIKRDINNELQLIASVGIAPNKFLAKLASGWDKPDGFTVIQQNEVQPFLDALPVERLWGVGASAQARLAARDVHTVAQLRALSLQQLSEFFGRNGERLHQLARGIDHREVIAESEAKSISQETTFASDIDELRIIESVALGLTESVGYRLRRAGLRARSMHLKLRRADFSTITRAHSITTATDSTDAIWQVVVKLIRNELTTKRFSLRLIGIGVTNFAAHDNCDDAMQTDLLADNTQSRQHKQGKVDALMDEIRNRYPNTAIQRGTALKKHK